jgi:glutathione gamma-glutamylcysteinyltransferase
MKQTGVTLQFFDRIAQSQPGIKVIMRGPDSLSAFKDALNAAAAQQDTHMIVSFSREGLGQTGIGHFSPVAAVHPERGLALVLDVARFKYPPYWVRIEELFEAMKHVDPVTQLPRGYCLIRRI